VKRLQSPLAEAVVRELRCGETIALSGVIYTARDAAHARLVAAEREKPLDLKGQTIYYVGPCPAPPGKVIGSAGPTTAARMDPYTIDLLRGYGVRAVIGKGNRSAEVRRALVEHGAVYLLALGGAGALIASCVREAEVVAYPDLGPEAIYRLRVEDLPLFVGIDTLGNDIYQRN
jgi:fumarate hydratase subunit beta